MTINERIKLVRKNKGWNQTELASLLGVSQAGISYMEKVGSVIADSTVKALCMACNLNEDWLRYGTEPMYIEQRESSIDELLKGKDISDLEMAILKAYFEIDFETRKMLIQHFKDHLLNIDQEETRSQIEARTLRQEADAVERGNGKLSVSPATKEA